MTKLTLQDFVHSLMGTRNNSKKELKRATREWSCSSEIEQAWIKWNGSELYIHTPSYDKLDCFDSFVLAKHKGYYYFDLAALNYFTFEFEMIGKQLIKNKEYKIIDFYE